MNGSELPVVALLVIFPVLAAVIGATLAASRPPSARLSSAAQHFAAGAVLAAIAIEVLPGLSKQGHPAIASIGFALGAAILLGRDTSPQSPTTVTHPAEQRKMT